MPTLTTIDSLTIHIYARNEHNPPHIHVKHKDQEVKIAIQNGQILAGEIPPKKLKVALRWLSENKEKCLLTWNTLNPHLRA
jgi:Domain of unknown function (DUF4160)